MRSIWKILLVTVSVFSSSCSPNNTDEYSKLIIGNWKAVKPGEHADIAVIDSLRFKMILRSDVIDSLGFEYKLKKDSFFIYYTIFASGNKILKLTNDSFIYCRPGDKDTFAYVRMK